MDAPVLWRVWLKSRPETFTEVVERDWVDACALGALDLSQQTGAEILLESVEAAPVESNLLHLVSARARLDSTYRARPAHR